MGYEIHITRKNEWSDEDGPEISLEDWKAYIASDPEMRLDGYAEATMENGDVFRTEHDGIAVWTAYSGIVAKNPDREILAKMFEIAQALGARVVGDEGEEYGTDGEMAEAAEAVEEAASPGMKQTKRPWWKIF